MAVQIWVDSWQMQCCGDPFAVGDNVAWTTSPIVDRDYLGTVLGADVAAQITACEDHHDIADEPTSLTTGLVDSIRAVSCRFAEHDRVLVPVEGAGVSEKRSEANGWESETDDVRFVGYVVTLRE